MRWFLLIVGVVTIPLFLLGLFAIKLSFQKLRLEEDALVVQSIFSKRIPYADIEGIDSRVGAGWGVVIRSKGFYNIPVQAFAEANDFKAQLRQRIGGAG